MADKPGSIKIMSDRADIAHLTKLCTGCDIQGQELVMTHISPVIKAECHPLLGCCQPCPHLLSHEENSLLEWLFCSAISCFS